MKFYRKPEELDFKKMFMELKKDEIKEVKKALINDKNYINCKECHIEPDLLLIYQVHDKELLLLLINIGSHSELFRL